ncbi:uncharacterized protein SPPG_07171 [Spizellomyces punctatus DAOM BR117]|uniref:histidine kinase n=1 Tax=Spizellomyces punctatus (strain DAOM BR117) TaxID=645134 RepID=A0A0L0H9Y5_SPIPD|nr:uncharacterized protein SPPG_07171 [Spizellomyces punctatus DAOM BR117]KNC97709.1 hypothetical protein SPPG_07171 [Spizellomyces punctatus DAOM BR117]|eukprot:XP_016605749.1 hypothetical protein SPPG_07171 [Spizellomyces punctatus DAOM BR117]
MSIWSPKNMRKRSSYEPVLPRGNQGSGADSVRFKVLGVIIYGIDFFIPKRIKRKRVGSGDDFEAMRQLLQTRITVCLLLTTLVTMAFFTVQDLVLVIMKAKSGYSVPPAYLSIMDPLTFSGTIIFSACLAGVRSDKIDIRLCAKIAIFFILALFTFICMVSDAFWKLGHSGFLIGPPFGYFLVDRKFGTHVGYITVLLYMWSFYWSLGRQLPPLESHQWYWVLGDIYVITCGFYVLGSFDQLMKCQKRLQDDVQHEREANQAKSRFISSMSHELRTPLHGILANVELLNDLCTNDSQRTLLSTIECSGQNLLGIINQVLVYSKAESGAKQCENVYEFDLFKLIEEVLSSLGPVGFKKGITMSFFLESLSPYFRRTISSEGCLRQILVNLLGNSIKFTQVGAVDLIITDTEAPPESNPLKEAAPKAACNSCACDRPRQLRPTCSNGCSKENKPSDANEESFSDADDQESDKSSLEEIKTADLRPCSVDDEPETDYHHKRRVTFRISDSGCGMAESFLEKMFAPFEQEATNKDRLIKAVEGTGLGMSIVKTLLDEMGGTIEVDSVVGQGTTITITIDLFYPSDTSWVDADLQRLDGEFFSCPVSERKKFIERIDSVKLGVWKSEGDSLGRTRLGMYLTRWGVPFETIEARWDYSDVDNVDIGAECKKWKAFDILVLDDEVGQLRWLDRISHTKDRPVIIYFTALQNFQEVCQAAAPWHGQIRFAVKPAGPAKILPILWDILMNSPGAAAHVSDATLRDLIATRGKLDAELEMDQMKQQYEMNGLTRERTDSCITVRENGDSASDNNSITDRSEGSSEEAIDEFRILIAEDNAINQRILSTFLTRKNLPHDIVENGQLAVDAWRERQHRLILMDVQMPVMNGIVATSSIRALDKESIEANLAERGSSSNVTPHPRTNIVVMTGLDNPEDERAALAAGADLFLTKPVSMRKLHKYIQEIQDAHAAFRQRQRQHDQEAKSNGFGAVHGGSN